MNEDDRVSLREFILVQLRAVEARFAQYVEHNSEQLRRTEMELNRRLEGMNEFREENRQLTNKFVIKEQYETRHEDLIRRISELEKNKNVREGQLALILVLITIVIAIIKYFH